MRNTNTTLITAVFTSLSLTACSESQDATPPPLPADLAAGKRVVENTCIACHGQGLNGAPILGNSKMWAKRLPQGEDVLVDHAINGFAYDMMPPRGGNPDLSDEDIRFAVRYMMHLANPSP